MERRALTEDNLEFIYYNNSKEHEIFERHENDLFCEVPIKFSLACLGGNIFIPTLFGKEILKSQ